MRAHRSASDRPARRSVVAWVALGLVLAGAAACELEEITIVEVEPVVVAEVYADVAPDGESAVRAFLHWTVGFDTVGLAPLGDTRLTVRTEAGATFPLIGASVDNCVGTFEPLHGEFDACFLSEDEEAPNLVPGSVLEIEIELPDGGALEGATRLPEAFDLVGFASPCRVAPNTPVTVRWTRSEGAWAYVNETSLRGLPAALADEGIHVEDDPLYLLGLSISATDTTIVFPSEFGLFNRFELDQDVAVRLQRGLPRETIGEVSITAVDRNYVNWARGGSFNPSGQVRVPSLRGDGTGVFGATFRRSFVVVASPSEEVAPLCAP